MLNLEVLFWFLVVVFIFVFKVEFVIIFVIWNEFIGLKVFDFLFVVKIF